MNTFLPYPNFAESLECLDNVRLWKQVIECYQLLRALRTGYPRNVRNHPACKMWVGNECSLYVYARTAYDTWMNRPPNRAPSIIIRKIIREWKILERKCAHRYVPVSNLPAFNVYMTDSDSHVYIADTSEPEWLGLKEFHDAMKSSLLRKDPEFYGKYKWDVPTDLEYLWKRKEYEKFYTRRLDVKKKNKVKQEAVA